MEKKISADRRKSVTKKHKRELLQACKKKLTQYSLTKDSHGIIKTMHNRNEKVIKARDGVKACDVSKVSLS